MSQRFGEARVYHGVFQRMAGFSVFMFFFDKHFFDEKMKQHLFFRAGLVLFLNYCIS